MAKTARREEWGQYRREDGSLVTMIRGAHNRTWFEDESGGRVGPEQSNVFPAMCWVYGATDWISVETPVMLQVACRNEVRSQALL